MKRLPAKRPTLIFLLALLLVFCMSVSAQIELYTVQYGDSVSSIAAHFQITAEALIEHNNLRRDERLLRGQILRIPVADDLSISHQVRTQDSLQSIAARYGISVAALVSVNNMQSEAHLIPGQRLLLPAEANDRFRARHKVQPGEALREIGERYGISWRTLAAVNNLANPNLIYAGQILIVPDEESKPVETTAQAPDTSGLPVLHRLHIVRAGEQFDLLAQRYALPLQDLLDLNHVRGEARLYSGDIVLLPAASAIVTRAVPERAVEFISHVVRFGETLGTIAARYEVSLADIVADNGLINPNVIHVGHVLVIR